MTYSSDLQDRVLYYRNKMKYSIRKIAKILLISKSTVHRWINNIHTKVVIKSTVNKNIKILHFLKYSLTQNPFQTLETLKSKINKKFKIKKSNSIISKYIKIIGFKRKRVQKKLYSNTLNEHKSNKKQFIKKIKKINKKDIICIDESYIDGSLYKKYGWCKKSKKLIIHQKRKNVLEKHSLIMAISINGILDYKLLKKRSINKKIFSDFLKDLLENVKNKYVLMDNISFHKSKEIIEIVEKNNNKILFIPPYSPEFNPIEEVFAKLKSFIRNNINLNNFNKKIHLSLKKFIKKVKCLKNYYKHAFGE